MNQPVNHPRSSGRCWILTGVLLSFVLFSLGCSSAPTRAAIPQTSETVWQRQPAATQASAEEEYLFDLSFPMIVSVVDYTGQSRPISSAKRKFFVHLKESLPDIEAFLELYSEEILVSEGPERMWLPIQKAVFERLKEEIGPYGTIVVFVRFAGLAPGDEPVFFIIDYMDREALPGVPESSSGFI